MPTTTSPSLECKMEPTCCHHLVITLTDPHLLEHEPEGPTTTPSLLEREVKRPVHHCPPLVDRGNRGRMGVLHSFSQQGSCFTQISYLHILTLLCTTFRSHLNDEKGPPLLVTPKISPSNVWCVRWRYVWWWNTTQICSAWQGGPIPSLTPSEHDNCIPPHLRLWWAFIFIFRLSLLFNNNILIYILIKPLTRTRWKPVPVMRVWVLLGYRYG